MTSQPCSRSLKGRSPRRRAETVEARGQGGGLGETVGGLPWRVRVYSTVVVYYSSVRPSA
jgi:hypothetical protein